MSLAAGLAVSSAAAAQQVDPLVENSNDAVELQQLGIQFIANNRARDALAALRKSLDIYPENAETHMWLGVTYAQLGEDPAAEKEFERALELNPNLTEVHNWFGVYWARRGSYDKAIVEYEKALADPAYPPLSRARVQANLGNVLMATGDYDGAVTTLSRAAAASIPSNDPLYALVHPSLADALIKTGRPREALGALERMDSLPASARVELLKGMAYRDLGENGTARDHLGRVLRLAPGSDLAREATAIIDSLPDGD